MPLLISVPAFTSEGSRILALAELMDLYPTLAELCGLPSPATIEGKSLVPVLADPKRSVKPAAFTQHPRPAYYDREPPYEPRAMGYSVRTREARYTEWRDWKTGATLASELYVEADQPAEMKNVAGDPAFASVRNEAASLLRAQFLLRNE